jgi:hypothetical protein
MRIILALVLESRTRNAARAASDQQGRLRLRPELSPSNIVSDNLRRSVVRIIITAPILYVNYLFLFEVTGCGAEGCLGQQF